LAGTATKQAQDRGKRKARADCRSEHFDNEPHDHILVSHDLPCGVKAPTTGNSASPPQITPWSHSRPQAYRTGSGIGLVGREGRGSRFDDSTLGHSATHARLTPPPTSTWKTASSSGAPPQAQLETN
jgi:hypothetical protein